MSDGALPGLELPLVSFISVHLIHQGFQEICSRRAAPCQIRSENVTGSENLVEDVFWSDEELAEDVLKQVRNFDPSNLN